MLGYKKECRMPIAFTSDFAIMTCVSAPYVRYYHTIISRKLHCGCFVIVIVYTGEKEGTYHEVVIQGTTNELWSAALLLITI